MKTFKYVMILIALQLIVLYTVGCQANGSLQEQSQQNPNDHPIEDVQEEADSAEPFSEEGSTEEEQTEPTTEENSTEEKQTDSSPDHAPSEDIQVDDQLQEGEFSDPSVNPDTPPADDSEQAEADPEEQSTEQPEGEDASQQDESPLITISIHGIGEEREILDSTKFTLESGDTVLDLLKRVTRQQKIQMEYQGRGMLAYVEGIDNLYELDHGAQSGWVYHVNGEAPSEAAGTYTPAEGDRIEWLYTLDLGDDVSEQE